MWSSFLSKALLAGFHFTTCATGLPAAIPAPSVFLSPQRALSGGDLFLLFEDQTLVSQVEHPLRSPFCSLPVLHQAA